MYQFGAGKVENPFAVEERKAIQMFSEGTNKILNMHNAAELTALCGVLCLQTEGTNKERKDRILKMLADETLKTRNAEKAYSNLLHLVWEGILFEYLRGEGAPLKTAEVR